MRLGRGRVLPEVKKVCVRSEEELRWEEEEGEWLSNRSV